MHIPERKNLLDVFVQELPRHRDRLCFGHVPRLHFLRQYMGDVLAGNLERSIDAFGEQEIPAEAVNLVHRHHVNEIYTVTVFTSTDLKTLYY